MVSRTRQRRWAGAKTVGLAIWIALVSLFLLWQATSYRGIMSLIGEWQFNVIGRHYPTFNYVFLVFLLSLPGYLLFFRPRKRATAERLEAATFRSARVLMKAMLGAAIGLAGAALIIVIVMLSLPRESGSSQLIDLSKPVPAVLSEGPATISGHILYERTAGLDEDMLLVHRNYRFAPVTGAGQPGTDLRFFVQLPPADDQSRDGAFAMSGVLKRNGLPGEVVRLFRYAGYQVEEPNYVLFVEPSAMRWPYLTLVVQLAIGAILALLFALVQRRRVRHIDRQIHVKPLETLSSA
ncbi:hypothetical protein [Sphingomonas bacterium]|uniref:hypothetical protein n=1 Tax=Sphingomonas bacterium TaxID=1895847 RepID=UPI0015756B13|nr:hypothetical protein [Sphingomonas bacterium]